MSKERVGIIGPGRMGLAMVKHLINAGYTVAATDINQEQLKKAEELGAKAYPDAAALGAESDYVIIAVGFDDETREVTIGERGLLESMTPGTIIAISSTASPETVRMIDAKAQEKGIDVFDAPTCRGRWAADEGTLLALVGGKDEVVERSRPIFGTFCSDIAHLGGVGHGQFGKAMNNYLMWINGLGLIEAGRLAEEFGTDLVKLREALLMSSGRSAAMEDWDRMTFTWALKDMQIVSEVSDKVGLSLPIVGAVKELVKEARRIKATNPPDWTGEGGIAKKP